MTTAGWRLYLSIPKYCSSVSGGKFDPEYTSSMQDNAQFFFVLRIVFTCFFILTLVAGAYLFKNYQKLFGVDPNAPSESGSARFYSKTLIFLLWGHAVLITGGFALMMR